MMSFVCKNDANLSFIPVGCHFSEIQDGRCQPSCLVGQPIDPIHEFCTKMDFLTQITYILMGHTYILPKVGILAILKNVWQPCWILLKK